MGKHKPTKAESAIIAVIAVLILTIVKFHDQLLKKNLLFPLMIALFVGLLGFIGFLVIKMWKQSDEEFLGFVPSEPTSAPPWVLPSFRDRLRFFLGAIAMVLFILVKEKQVNPGSLIFCGFVLTIASIYFLPALIQKLRGRENEPLFANTNLRPDHFVFMFFGLFGVCFCGFFCYIVITKLPPRIAIPCLFPPLIIGSAFARPLVAGIRILLRSGKPKEKDPWDRPDRKL